MITADEAGSDDSTACCGEIAGPNSPMPGINGPGGGRVGALVLSPFVKRGSTSTTAYNHYSLLASIESFFGLPRLGYAATVPASCTVASGVAPPTPMAVTPCISAKRATLSPSWFSGVSTPASTRTSPFSRPATIAYFDLGNASMPRRGAMTTVRAGPAKDAFATA